MNEAIPPHPNPPPQGGRERKCGWLNRTVLGAGLTSLLADLSYETALVVLPGYLTLIGSGPAILGAMEGAADALASFVKLGAGWWSDKVDRRKPFAVVGYALTGIMPALMAIAVSWPLVMVARLIGWFGKGLRGPARDALLSASVPSEHRGKAFGLHRAGDTVGAILGPLVAAELLQRYSHTVGDPQRFVLWWAVVPGIVAAFAFLFLVKEIRGAAVKRYAFGEAVRQLPPRFRKYLVGIGLFGMGDFSHILLIAAATTAMTPQYGFVEAGVWAARLYALRNFAAALTAFPVGAISDRIGRLKLLAIGYLLAAAVMWGIAWIIVTANMALWPWAVVFCFAGIYIAIEETLEGAATADLVDDPQLRGTAFGILGAVNGLGDFVSSLIVGGMMAYSPVFGFIYAAVMMLIGHLWISTLSKLNSR